MTILAERPEESEFLTPLSVEPGSFRRHLSTYRSDYILVVTLAILAAVTRMYNLENYPRWFLDEGIYVMQAWSVLTTGELSPYTFWYDHPPLGWIQLAGWLALTGGLQRYSGETNMAGREFMVVMAIATAILIYVLVRRLGLRRVFAVVASLLWILSPLSMSFSRLVLLDNIAVPWLLASMVLALSPNRRLSAVVGSALCLAVAILTKETALLVAPAVMYMGWQHYRQSENRAYANFIFPSLVVAMGIAYPLYAALKGELLPGPDHVSLWEGQIMFQLASRGGSGSVFDPNSLAYGTINLSWLPLDNWLPYAGVAAFLPALFIPKLQGPAIALGVQIAMFFRGGYVPFPFIITLLPFMAILVAGLAEAVWPTLASFRRDWWSRCLAVTGVILVAAMAIGFGLYGVPDWRQSISYEYAADDTTDQRQAINWADENIPEDSVIVAESEIWLDIRNLGFDDPEVIWSYKLDADPEVLKDLAGRPLDYLIVKQDTLDRVERGNYPTLLSMATESELLASFGEGENKILVMKTKL